MSGASTNQESGLRLRGTAVGALTAALAFAAHGYGGADLPSSRDLLLLLIGAGVVGAIVAETSWLTRGRLPMLAALLCGQTLGHLILVASASGHALVHPHTIGWPMLLAHLAAAAACVALIELVERLYGPLTTLVRAAVSTKAPTPVAARGRLLPRVDVPRSDDGIVGLHSISRRGPPVRV